MLSYYKRWLLTGHGNSYLIDMVEAEYPLETAHLQLGVWVRSQINKLNVQETLESNAFLIAGTAIMALDLLGVKDFRVDRGSLIFISLLNVLTITAIVWTKAWRENRVYVSLMLIISMFVIRSWIELIF